MSFFNSEEDGIEGTLFLNGREREFVIPRRRITQRVETVTYPVFGLWAYYCGYKAENEVAAKVSVDGGPWMTTKAIWQSMPGRHTATFKYTPPGGKEQTIVKTFVTEDVIAGQRAGGVFGIDAFFPCQRIVEPSAPIMRIPEWEAGWEGIPLIPNQKPASIYLPYACACCGYRFGTIEEKDVHQIACVSCRYVCPCCEARFPTIIERDNHQAVCPLCVQVPTPSPTPVQGPTPSPTPTTAIPTSIIPIGTAVAGVPAPIVATAKVGVQAVALPSWALPVGILLGVGLILFIATRKKKKK